ncbi:MAG: hypothetical protein GXO24_05695 [Chlorobi bacterium]|nr:hypothetical protein [Chlorobiota bacterium]
MNDFKEFHPNNTSYTPATQNQPPTNRGLMILTVLLGLLAAGMAVVGYMKYKDFKQTEQTLESEKEALLNDLNELKVNYDTLSTENDELKQEVQEAKTKVEQLIEELQKVKKADAAIIAKYRKQIAYFRKQRDKLLRTVDSLKQANQVLALQKDSLNQELVQTKEYSEKVAEENQKLAEQVQQAQTLIPANIVTDGVRIRSNGKVVVTTRKWRTQQLRVCMVMPANPVAPKGTKTVYVQVVNPAGKVIGNKDVINVDGEEVITSASKEFDYNGQNTDVCVFVVPQDRKAEILKGNYLINIYMDGKKTGTANFHLK